MSNPRPGHPHKLLIDLAWFVPALAVFSLAVFVRHPAVAIALLVGDGLTMIAIAHALHLRRRPADVEPLVLGGMAYTALLAAYAAVFALRWRLLRRSWAWVRSPEPGSASSWMSSTCT